LRHYRDQLYKDILEGGVQTPWPDTVGFRRASSSRGHGISPDVYDRRLPIYQKTVAFVRLALGTKIDIQQIFQFAADTELALFLFDESIEGYLSILYQKATHLREIELRIQNPTTRWALSFSDDSRSTLGTQEGELLGWFVEQYAEVRTRFAPFLRLDSGISK
jgi:hypothetical protein